MTTRPTMTPAAAIDGEAAMKLEEFFERCVTRKVKAGELTTSCKLGLWAVSGQHHTKVEREARHYWIQYFNDGEYNSLLGLPPQPPAAVAGGNKGE